MQTPIDSQAGALDATSYAGFGQRFLALIIDGIVISIIYFIILTPILTAIGFGIATEAQDMQNLSDEEQAAAAVGFVGTIIAMMGTVIITILAIQILYYTLMESSRFQGSLGKMALGIKVVDLEGNRISVGKAFVRSIGKIISNMIMYIGYLMAAFTERKQGLHDIIASTLVVKK